MLKIQSTMTTVENTNGCESNDWPDNDNLDDDFGDFADFQEAEPVINDDESSLPKTTSSSTEPNSTDCQTIATSSTNLNTSSTNLNLDSIINQSFTKASEDESEERNKSIPSALFNDKTSQSYKLWQNLINFEESTSLKLNWQSSHTFQVLLRSLKIDPKNISFSQFSQANSDESASNNSVANLDWSSSGLVNNFLEPVQSNSNNWFDLNFFMSRTDSTQHSPKASRKLSNLEAELLEDSGKSPSIHNSQSLSNSNSADPLQSLISQINKSWSTGTSIEKSSTLSKSKINQYDDDFGEFTDFKEAKLVANESIHNKVSFNGTPSLGNSSATFFNDISSINASQGDKYDVFRQCTDSMEPENSQCDNKINDKTTNDDDFGDFADFRASASQSDTPSSSILSPSILSLTTNLTPAPSLTLNMAATTTATTATPATPTMSITPTFISQSSTTPLPELNSFTHSTVDSTDWGDFKAFEDKSDTLPNDFKKLESSASSTKSTARYDWNSSELTNSFPHVESTNNWFNLDFFMNRANSSQTNNKPSNKLSSLEAELFSS